MHERNKITTQIEYKYMYGIQTFMRIHSVFNIHVEECSMQTTSNFAFARKL